MPDYLPKFFKYKTVRILIAMLNCNGAYVGMIMKKVDTTDSHAFKTIKLLEKHGLVTTEKTGRIRRVFLTQYGRDLANRISTVFNKIKELGEESEAN